MPQELGRKDSKGRFIIPRVKVDAKFANPDWSDEWEDEFKDRADAIVKHSLTWGKIRGNTYFENEKRTYGQVMLQALAGEVEHAASVLQGRDHQADLWHKNTAGIDYYACFTLKHQMRKYFFFGDILKPDYVKQMYDGAKAWTQVDPLRRDHYAYKGESGWGPNAKNSWVDVRSTDNLFLMRTVSVYLMAEETGNEKTRLIYKDRFATFVKSLYRIGMGEWDSENYHGHSIAPVHNLYDFAKDPAVKLLAKACLDWFYATGALKYRRGGFNGPSKRDYCHVKPFGGSAAGLLWVMFGDTPLVNEHLESDEVHVITSAYRPPAAVVNLARKNFDVPVEIFSAKCGYSDTQEGDYDAGPEYFETQYIGRTFQFGTLAKGTQEPDVNGFKILMDNSRVGMDMISCVCGSDPLFTGSPKYQEGKLNGPSRIAQYSNIGIWLVKKGDSDWVWVMPKTVEVEVRDDILFLGGEKTYVAFYPLNLTIKGNDDKLTEKINFKVKGNKKESLWPDHKVVSAKGKGGQYCGFAIEFGEVPEFTSLDKFIDTVCSKGIVYDINITDGVAEYKGTGDCKVKLEFGDTLETTKVWRNGSHHDWQQHNVCYRQTDRKSGLIEQDWMGGTLTVKAADREFSCTVDDNGKVTFYNR